MIENGVNSQSQIAPQHETCDIFHRDADFPGRMGGWSATAGQIIRRS
jgi:hypothetical protein